MAKDHPNVRSGTHFEVVTGEWAAPDTDITIAPESPVSLDDWMIG